MPHQTNTIKTIKLAARAKHFYQTKTDSDKNDINAITNNYNCLKNYDNDYNVLKIIIV